LQKQFRKLSSLGTKKDKDGKKGRSASVASDIGGPESTAGPSTHLGPSFSFPLRQTRASTSATDPPPQGNIAESGPLGLTVVYTPNNGHKVDIVFVHGLGGTSRWTWSKNRKPELFWPLTFLPLEPDICLARIMTFGYNAQFQKAGSVTTSVLDFAKGLLFDLKYGKDQHLEELEIGNVPLIFVVHSMGGLIVKEV
jgi:hypothetical protein